MKNSKFRRCFAAIAAAALMTTAVPSMPLTVSAANMITNSTFESGTKDWGLYKQSGGVASLTTEDGKLALKISNVGEVNYAVQAFYDIIPLYKNGVYRLKYDISSTIDRDVEGMIQQNGGTYQSYTWKGLSLTSTPQSVDYEFTMEYESDIMAKLVFNCGTQGEDLPEHTIYLDNVSLELIDDSNVDYTSTLPYAPDINLNQVGYKTDSNKYAVIREFTNETEFSVINADTKAVVYTGKLSDATNFSLADEVNKVADFSEVKEAGKYYISCGELDDSYTFEIGDDVYTNLLDDTVKMLYLQRCGTKVEDDDFGHVACHNSKATIYGTSEKIDVTGGWHDAGDYGRYIVPAAKTIADLLYAYGENPELFGDNLGIPESGNGVADILDEARYELEWMFKMQASSGGVYHKVTCATFPGYIMPEMEKDELLVTPVSTTATADFCASMALAYEFYKDIDKTFADKCLAAAEKAWAFLEQNPNFIFKNPGTDIVTGEYGDRTDTDERYWAGVQMYRATGDTKYLTAIERNGAKIGLDWSTVGDYGNIAILTMDGVDTTSTVYNDAKSAVIKQANSFVGISDSSAYGVALDEFNWGSNMTVANAGIITALAYKLTGDSKYLDAANAQTNYLLGVNPCGTSFVTGYGTVSPEAPHHRPSMAQNKAMKGMLVGGVNQNLEDSAAKAYCQSLPAAKRYVDNSESYSTNEITIYWNSPLTYLLALTDGTESQPTTDPAIKADILGDANCDKSVDIADVVAVKCFMINPQSFALSKQGQVNADVQATGNGINSQDVLAIQKYVLQIIEDFSNIG